MTRRIDLNTIDADLILQFLEEYLHQLPPRGYTSDDFLEAGMPRMESSNVLAKAMAWKLGGDWTVAPASNDRMMLFKGRRSNITYWEAEYELSPLLKHFVHLTDQLHTGSDPRMWYGNVRFWEARQALQQAKDIYAPSEQVLMNRKNPTWKGESVEVLDLYPKDQLCYIRKKSGRKNAQKRWVPISQIILEEKEDA